jgi:tetratricopeptide (TPR) repeat protein
MSIFHNEPETVYLTRQSALDFGVVKADKKSKSFSFQPASISEQNGEISIAGKLDGVETTLAYRKDALSDQQRIFIAWMHLILRFDDFGKRDEHKEAATTLIKDALEDELDGTGDGSKDRWMFPYYLISNYELDVAGVPNALYQLYKFLHDKKPHFVWFYREILRREKNPIRKVAVARVAEKHYPKENWFIREIADDLFEQRKYDECIRYLQTVKRRFRGDKSWQEMDARLTLWKCYLKKNNYRDALRELETPLRDQVFDADYTDLLRGVVLCRQKKWAAAITCFERTIAADYRNGNASLFASYYLIECYVATKNATKLEQVVSGFPLQQDDLFIYGIPFHYGADATAILRKALKSKWVSEPLRAKLKGMLAYLLDTTLPPRGQDGVKRKLSKKETADAAYAIRLVQDALDFYPNEVFFSALCSNLLNDKGEHDRAMDFKLRSLQRDGGPSSIFPEAELEHCTTAYQEAYAQKVRDALSESGVRQYIDNYALQSDIGTLWKRKLYSQIAELFKFVKPSINNYQEIGEMREYIGGGGLFEIAYALSETGDLNEALQTYEKAAEPDWDDAAILNNIAIVYEKKGDLKKAKEMIVKAKSLSPDDEVVLNNYRRMFADGKDAGNDKPRSETRVPKPKKEKLSFDMATGEISFGNKKCEIPIGTNQYQLCKALFTQPLGEWLKETDVVEEFYRGKESRRAFYDAIRLTNQKVEQGLKIRKLLAYDAARVKIRTDGLG